MALALHKHQNRFRYGNKCIDPLSHRTMRRFLALFAVKPLFGSPAVEFFGLCAGGLFFGTPARRVCRLVPGPAPSGQSRRASFLSITDGSTLCRSSGRAIPCRDQRAMELSGRPASRTSRPLNNSASSREIVETAVQETLAYNAFPEEPWRRIRTNNPLERILREIRRRTRVVGAFPDGQSALNLVAARLRHIAGTACSTKRYLNIELLKDQQMRGRITA